MTWSVLLHPEVTTWLKTLDETTSRAVADAIEVLESEGPNLRRPLADTLHGTKLKNLKELRPGSANHSEIRILFAFDPERQAILLVAGDKAGEWNRWYKRMIPVAEQRFNEHLARLRKKGGRS